MFNFNLMCSNLYSISTVRIFKNPQLFIIYFNLIIILFHWIFINFLNPNFQPRILNSWWDLGWGLGLEFGLGLQWKEDFVINNVWGKSYG